MSYHTERYQVVREPDNRGVVIDAQNFHFWVFGPASIAACRKVADEMNEEYRSAKPHDPEDWDVIDNRICGDRTEL